MAAGECPRCGAWRPDDLRWCRKCGLDFEASRGSVIPPSPGLGKEPEARQAPASEPSRIDVRPVNDRRNMAQWTLDAFTVRCLATVGGLVGGLVGFLVFGYIALVLNLGLASILVAMIGFPVGMVIGIRFALKRLAR